MPTHRFCKARPNSNCLFVCGTDEYGTATETAALSAGITCQELVHSSLSSKSELPYFHKHGFNSLNSATSSTKSMPKPTSGSTLPSTSLGELPPSSRQTLLRT